MTEKSELVQAVSALHGERYVITHTPTAQVLGVDGWNQYGDAKQMFDTAEEVADAWFELGLHEAESAKQDEYEIISLSDSVSP